MVRPGSGRFGVGFWVGFWVGLRARDFPTERVLSRTPLIIRTVDQKEHQWVPYTLDPYPTNANAHLPVFALCGLWFVFVAVPVSACFAFLLLFLFLFL